MNGRPHTLRFAVLFGAMYFVQGIAEPTEGLIAQPVRALLKGWGRTPAEIGTFSALIALPWAIKPLYGLITDYIPLAGRRRRPYLLTATAATVCGLTILYLWPPKAGHDRMFLWLLLLPTIGVAFSDVVIDALMIEKGQPHGLTGLLQSVQWCAMYAATILTGLLGGYLSQHRQAHIAFLICAVMTLATLVLSWVAVREDRGDNRVDYRGASQSLMGVLRRRGLWGTALFVWLWNFNPNSATVLYLYSTTQLGFSEQFYGTTVSLFSVGAILACITYGMYCRKIPFRRLVHLSILANVASTLAYYGMSDNYSAVIISLFVGFTYMTGSLILMDVVARGCPLDAAGTTFALMMGLANLAVSLSSWVGGYVYEWGTQAWDTTVAFHCLVLLGTVTTGSCWALLPWLHAMRQPTADQSCS